jgi:hypothetical protein
LYDDLLPTEEEQPQRRSLARDVLDFEETGDVAKGLVRAGSGMLSAVGEGGTRLLASGADVIGLARAAANLRRQADAARADREGVDAALPYRTSVGVPAQIVGNVAANIAGGDIVGTGAAAASRDYSTVGLAADLLKKGTPGPVRRTLARGAEKVAESPLGRAAVEYGLSRATGGAIGAFRRARAARQAAPKAAGLFDDLVADIEPAGPITDPARLLPPGPPDQLHGPAIPMRGAVQADVTLPDVPTTARDIPSARTASGGLRDLTKLEPDALMREYAERAESMLNAQERSVYRFVDSEGGTKDAYNKIATATRRGGGPSEQAKAFRNLEQINQTMRKIEGEWARRGLDEMELYRGTDLLEVERRAARTGAYEDVERASMSSLVEPKYNVGDAEGFALFSNPLMDPALLTRALRTREVRGAVLSASGVALKANTEDEKLEATGNGLIALGLLHGVGMARIRAGAGAAGAKIADGMKQSPLGRKALNAISYDILAQPDVKAAVAAFEEEVGKGAARATKVGKLTERLTPAMDRAVSDVIEGEGFEAAARTMAPADAKLVAGIARKISDEFTELGQAKVGAGLLSSETVAKREGRYLPRIYGQFFGKEGENIPEHVTAQGRKIRVRGDKARIDDLSPAIRNELGEIRESSFRATYGLQKGYRDVASAKLFASLKTMPGTLHPDYEAAVDQLMAASQGGRSDDVLNARAFLKSITDRAAADPGFVKMPDTPGMGVLRGAVVRTDVADYLNGVPKLKGAMGEALSYWKKVHTVYNPGTHAGNFASNIAKYHMAGLPVAAQPKWLARAKDGLKRYDTDVQFLAERGAINKNYATTELAVPLGQKSTGRALRELAGTSRPETKAALAARGIKPMGKVEKVLREGAPGIGKYIWPGADRVERAYAWEDNVFAVGFFKKLKAQGVAAEDAARQVAGLNDFSTRSPALGVVRTLASPFVLFTAKEAPRLFANIIEHPIRWMMIAATWGGMDQYSRRTLGAIPESDLRPDQRTNRMFGYLVPGTMQLPFGDKRGKAVADIGRWTPLGALTGGPAPGAMGTQLSDKIPPLLNPSGPLTDLGAALTNIDSFTGEKLIQPGDDARDIARIVGKTASKFVAPSAATFHAPRTLEDLRRGDTQAAKTDALGFIGARPSFVRPGMQRMREQRKLEEAIANIRADYRVEWQKARTPEAQERARARAMRRFEAVAGKARGLSEP